MADFTTKCRCGHTPSEHHRVIEKVYKCEKCKCENYTFSAMLQKNEETLDETEERLREVLRNKYQEFCPNCEKHLGISDASWDVAKFSYSCQITCQNCYKLLIDITTNHRRIKLKAVESNYKYNINYLIEVLNESSHLNQAK